MGSTKERVTRVQTAATRMGESIDRRREGQEGGNIVSGKSDLQMEIPVDS